MSSSYRSNRLGLSHWDPYAVRRGGCLELYYCNMVEWFWWDSSSILTTNWFPSVLDTVGLVIWPVKIVPEMTYYVSSGTLNTTQLNSTISEHINRVTIRRKRYAGYSHGNPAQWSKIVMYGTLFLQEFSSIIIRLLCASGMRHQNTCFQTVEGCLL